MSEPIKSLDEYIKRIDSDIRQYKEEGCLIDCITASQYKAVWFRGVKDCTYELLPSALRKENKISEKDLTHEFMLKSRIENISLTKYKEWLFIMQHHGVPTRMLDWSESCLVALYFALYELKKEKDVIINNPAVWMLNPLFLNSKSLGWDKFPSFEGELNEKVESNCRLAFKDKKDDSFTEFPIAIKSQWIDDRMVAQKSCFTIHGNNKIAIEDIDENENCRILTKYLIDKDKRDLLLEQLKLCGITHYSIYPDLDGLAKEIKNNYF